MKAESFINGLISSVGGKKFCFVVFCAVILGLLTWFGKISGDQFVAAMTVLGGGFLAAHAATDMTALFKGK